MSNRITIAIAQMTANINAKGLPKEKIDELSGKLDMDTGEFCRFQELKSMAVATNQLTTEEGMTIYHELGASPVVFNGRPLAVKACLTKLFAELL